MAIPDSILRKPGPLTDDEKQIMRTHCEIGYNMLIRIPFLRAAAEIVLAHQEFYDGSGYPAVIEGRADSSGSAHFHHRGFTGRDDQRPSLSQGFAAFARPLGDQALFRHAVRPAGRRRLHGYPGAALA